MAKRKKTDLMKFGMKLCRVEGGKRQIDLAQAMDMLTRQSDMAVKKSGLIEFLIRNGTRRKIARMKLRLKRK